MEPCDLLLLDEPTNHLDEEMIEWLEKELKQTKSAVCMVTHDRYFLDRITDTILEIDEGKFYIHHGNYATFLENKAIRQEQEVQKQKKLKALYKKELAWVRAGAQARSTKQQARLNRFEDLRNQRFKDVEKSLNLSSFSARLGKKTIEWEHLGMHYGNHVLFEDFFLLTFTARSNWYHWSQWLWKVNFIEYFSRGYSAKFRHDIFWGYSLDWLFPPRR